MMPAINRPKRLAAGALGLGGLAGLGAFAFSPTFERYVAGVMGLISGVAPLDGPVPGLGLSVAVAFLVGLSMNFLPCNLPIVMSLLPATADATSRRSFANRTGLYGIGAVGVLAALGFVLGAAGGIVRPFVLGYPALGVYVAGVVIGVVGLLSILWGLREVGVVDLPSVSLPFMQPLRNAVDRQSGPSEFVLLGAVYGSTGGGCPMPTYHLLLVWVVVAGSPAYGAVLLGTYALGRLLPVAVLGAAFHNQPSHVARTLRGRYGALRAVNGIALLSLGSLLLVFVGLRALVGGP